MKLGDLIQKSHIVEKLKAKSKEEAIAELVDVLVENGSIDPLQREEILLALLKREALSTTELGTGVAVPHAMVKSMRNVAGALGISSSGVSFDGKNPSHLIFLFVSPDHNPQEHLKLMAMVSHIASDPNYVDLLQQARNRPKITRLIREAEDRLFPEGPAAPL